MRRSIILAAIVLAAIIAGLIVFAGGSPEPSAPGDGAARRMRSEPASAPSDAMQGDSPVDVPAQTRRASTDAIERPAPADPRLAALMVSANDDLIQFVHADGKLIKEIDNDPNSAGFRKPLREYSYAGDKVVALSAYRYLGDQVQITRAAVSYKLDGSVDQYHEATSYEQQNSLR